MAKAYKCDRCGDLFDGEKRKDDIEVWKMNWRTPYNPKGQDLCLKCYESFERWWTDPEYESRKDRGE